MTLAAIVHGNSLSPDLQVRKTTSAHQPTDRRDLSVRHCLAALLLTLGGVGQAAERMNVRDLKEDPDWAKYARESTELQISGRYDGRVSRQFRLARLSIAITPARTTVLPNNLDAGQRISATGIIRKVGNRYLMEATRIVIGSTDLEKLMSAAARIADNQPEQIYELVEEYLPIAEFYDDGPLKVELATLRTEAFTRQRIANVGNPTGLKTLLKRGSELGVAEDVLQAIRFEALVAETKLKDLDVDRVLERIRESLPGWDVVAELDDDTEAKFQDDLIALYNSSSIEQRTALHRRFYRKLQLPILLAQADKEGRNALDVSRLIDKELPEETEAVAELRKRYVDYRMVRVPDLSRRQLEDLQTLLQEFDREPEFRTAVDLWVKAQEKRLSNGQLDGVMLTAEQYLYAFERWKNPDHQYRGIELLKQAWAVAHEIAPAEANNIAIQLERLGWIRLYDRWMSDEERSNLPADDIELAKREGRVVVGMVPDQVLGSQGEPARRIRVVSGRHVREIWVYGDEQAQTINIHLERLRNAAPGEAVVVLIARSAR